MTHLFSALAFTSLFSIRSLKDLAGFIKTADSGLSKEVKEGDYDGLVDCMGHLMAVKERQSTTDEMFEPLKQTIELLKSYDQEMPEEVHQQLQVIWDYQKDSGIVYLSWLTQPVLQDLPARIINKTNGEFREVFRFFFSHVAFLVLVQ